MGYGCSIIHKIGFYIDDSEPSVPTLYLCYQDPTSIEISTLEVCQIEVSTRHVIYIVYFMAT